MKKSSLSKFLILLMVAIFAISATACTKNEDKEKDNAKVPDNVVVSDVNGKPIEFEEFKNMYIIVLNNIIRYNRINTEEDLKNLLSIEIAPNMTQENYIKESALTRIINTHLIRDYMKSKGQTVVENEVNESVKAFKESAEKFSPETLAYYELNGITDEVIRGIFEDSQYVKKFEDDMYEEVKKEYEGDSAKLENTPIRVEASHILLETEEEAKNVLERVRKGEDFATLAKELSTDKVSGENGGELGYFGRGTMIKEFSDAAFSMNVGDVSEPVQSQFGYHIIKLTGRETYADVKAKNSDSNDLNMMLDQIIKTEVDARITQKIAELSKELKLEINYPVLFQKFEIKMPPVAQETPEAGAQTEKEDKTQETQTDKKEDSSSDKKN